MYHKEINPNIRITYRWQKSCVQKIIVIWQKLFAGMESVFGGDKAPMHKHYMPH